MSAWKCVALEKLTEYRGVINTAENPMALWIELYLKFKYACRAGIPDDDLIRRFFEYARWCRQSPGEGGYLSDAGPAAVCAFYEELPKHAGIRCDLPRWLSREEFTGLREAFRYHRSEKEFINFEAEFLRKSK